VLGLTPCALSGRNGLGEHAIPGALPLALYTSSASGRRFFGVRRLDAARLSSPKSAFARGGYDSAPSRQRYTMFPYAGSPHSAFGFRRGLRRRHHSCRLVKAASSRRTPNFHRFSHPEHRFPAMRFGRRRRPYLCIMPRALPQAISLGSFRAKSRMNKSDASAKSQIREKRALRTLNLQSRKRRNRTFCRHIKSPISSLPFGGVES